MPRLPPEQLESIRADVERGRRELLAFIRGEGPCPGIRMLMSMPNDRDYAPPKPNK